MPTHSSHLQQFIDTLVVLSIQEAQLQKRKMIKVTPLPRSYSTYA